MQTLYLIRHTTPDIAPGICYGQLDIGVADSFNDEASRVLNWMPPLDFILTSPLLRTCQLAGFLAQTLNCELKTDLRLMEKHFGTWEGLAWDTVPRHEINAWAADIMGYAPSGGESAQQLVQRVQNLLHDVAQQPRRSIGLVAHGGSIRAILAQLAGLPLTDTLNWQIEYGAVIAVQVSGTLEQDYQESGLVPRR